MAIDYTKLFNDIRNVVNYDLELVSFAASAETSRQALQASLIDSGLDELMTMANQMFFPETKSILNNRARLRPVVTMRLLDHGTIISNFPALTSTNVTNVLRALIADMLDQPETVNRCVVTLGSITRSVTNSGTGHLIVSKKITGAKRMSSTMNIITPMIGLDSEIPYSDTIGVYPDEEGISATCTVSGLPVSPEVTTGNQGSIKITAGGSNRLVNSTFATFTGNVPDSWTLVSGTAGTNVLQETTEFLTDSSSLEMTGNGQISYPMGGTTLNPVEVLNINCYMKKTAGATGTITIALKLNGSTLASLAVDVSTLSSSAWTLKHFEATTPANLGAALDSNTVLTITSASVSAPVWIDNMMASDYEYFAGLGFLMTIQKDPLCLGDSFVFSVTNDNGGTIQRWMIDNYGVQLPSSASSSIDD